LYIFIFLTLKVTCVCKEAKNFKTCNSTTSTDLAAYSPVNQSSALLTDFTQAIESTESASTVVLLNTSLTNSTYVAVESLPKSTDLRLINESSAILTEFAANLTLVSVESLPKSTTLRLINESSAILTELATNLTLVSVESLPKSTTLRLINESSAILTELAANLTLVSVESLPKSTTLRLINESSAILTEFAANLTLAVELLKNSTINSAESLRNLRPVSESFINSHDYYEKNRAKGILYILIFIIKYLFIYIFIY
jgi:hypothetical protein